MAILKIAQMGNPILRAVAKPVQESEIKTKDFQKFLQDMVETMREHEGLGLAAPQVHHSIRVSVIEMRKSNPDEQDYPNNNDKEPPKIYVFINPEIKPLTKETNSYWEGCLSVPGLRGLVSRPGKVNIKYLDENGKKCELTAEGFFATILQHEFDHLDGKLYIDRMTDMTKLAFDAEFEKYWLPD
jgi:peptide deformylase